MTTPSKFKAWCIVDTKGNILFDDMTYAIYEKRSEANNNSTFGAVVLCEIKILSSRARGKKIRRNEMIIAFDVDDTLILPPEATGLDRDTPNYELLGVYWFFKRQGHRIIVWSGGGKDYAQMWGEKLGLQADEYRTKEKDKSIDICFDDCIVDLAKVNIRVQRWNNSETRTPWHLRKIKVLK